MLLKGGKRNTGAEVVILDKCYIVSFWGKEALNDRGRDVTLWKTFINNKQCNSFNDSVANNCFVYMTEVKVALNQTAASKAAFGQLL